MPGKILNVFQNFIFDVFNYLDTAFFSRQLLPEFCILNNGFCLSVSKVWLSLEVSKVCSYGIFYSGIQFPLVRYFHRPVQGFSVYFDSLVRILGLDNIYERFLLSATFNFECLVERSFEICFRFFQTD